MESVYRFADSEHETVSMEIQSLHISKKFLIKGCSFRETKMYGTMFNYPGCMANAGYNNGCCVRQFIFDTLHNTSEKNNLRKRIATFTMKNVIGDLGMAREDEGCCITQSVDLCNKIKVIYYALGFKHKLFETNKDITPRLIFICANNHFIHNYR